MPRKLRYKGVTLIELTMVIMVISVLFIGGAEMVRLGALSYLQGQNILVADWQARTAFERMTRDLHTVRSASDITTATSSTLTFNDINGSVVTYQKTGTSLMRNTQVLADYVQSLTFNYYDQNGNAAATPSAIRYIVITLIIQKNTSFTFTTGVSLWNLI